MDSDLYDIVEEMRTSKFEFWLKNQTQFNSAHSSLVEQAAVNGQVVGSSPTVGANYKHCGEVVNEETVGHSIT